MTVNNKRLATFVASALIALPLSMNIASAEAIKTNDKQIIALDNTPTGSIQRADSNRNCDPTSPNAGPICKITGGNPNTKFPSAPTAAFGF